MLLWQQKRERCAASPLFCLFLRQQYPQGEPLILPMQGQGTAVGFGGGADAFQVIAAVGAAQGQAVGAKLYGLGTVVLEPQHHKAVLRSIMIRGNQSSTGWLICNREGTVVYCEMRVVDLDEPESIEYERIATIGSQQLQARMVTSYYGLSMDYIKSNAVLLGTA